MSEKKSGHEQPLRCGHCQRLLAFAGTFTSFHIKCPRCKRASPPSGGEQ
ncbi:Com family DNA-binding transcriptional regulator [Salmonella enterica]|nr:Com family DNA-binding transcriptional regulator [Salmonella enterica]MBH0740671.1 Com family DNA-binding transcriptional regulator [Salmonella enterica]